MSFNKEEEEAKKDSNQNEDNFGLPDLDYKPLDKLEESTDAVNQARQEDSPLMEEFDSTADRESVYREDTSPFIAEETPKSKAPLFIAILIAIVLSVAGFLVWKYVIQPSNLKAKQEQLAKEKARKDKEAQAKLAKQREEEERQRLAAEAAANAKPKEGVIEQLTTPTRKYYAVVASAVDGDLLMDYAKKLSAKGVSTKIIPPFGKWKFNRLTIGVYESFNEAQSAADLLKADYGNEVWVIRY